MDKSCVCSLARSYRGGAGIQCQVTSVYVCTSTDNSCAMYEVSVGAQVVAQTGMRTVQETIFTPSTVDTVKKNRVTRS